MKILGWLGSTEGPPAVRDAEFSDTGHIAVFFPSHIQLSRWRHEMGNKGG